MAIRVPFVGPRHQGSIRRVIEATARDMGVSEYLVAITMSHLFEKIAVEISHGDVVRIPGFGMFAPVRWVPRQKGLEGFAAPRFYASKGLKAEVRATCTPYPDNDVVRRFRLNHGGTTSRKRVFTAMRQMRDELVKDASKIGLDLQEYADAARK